MPRAILIHSEPFEPHTGSPVPGAVAVPVRRGDLAELVAVRDQLRSLRPDVLHAIGPTAARIAGLLRLPLVGLRPFPKLVVSGCENPDWLVRRGLAKAVAVLAYSDGEAERYREFVRPDRVRMIPPGAESCEPRPQGSGILDIPSSARVIAAVGNFDKWSGMKTAVWAFDLLKYVAPDVYLLLIGDGPERANVEVFARSLGRDDWRIRLAGHRTDVPDLLAAADLTWVASDRGGVSVALTAMAVGTPVVAMRTTDTAGVVVEGVTGRFTAPGDAAALAQATRELLADPELLQRMGIASRRTAVERFPLHATAVATTGVYESL